MAKRGNPQAGLQSEALRAALDRALVGETRALEDLLARFGGLPSPRPHLALAAAFGEEIAGKERGALALLEKLARDDADSDSPRAFLPVAAAHGLASRIAQSRDVNAAWAALFELATDDRAAVRIGTIDALEGLAPRSPTGADRMVERFSGWLEHEEREARWSATAIALEVLSARRTLETLTDEAALFDFLARALDDAGDAPRAAERSAMRRKVLAGIPGAISTAIATKKGGAAWLEERCAGARHPDLRAALEETLARLRKRGGAEKVETLTALSTALASSKKPPRDPTRSNEPARGRERKARGRGA
ncbi:MAG: hypothetical protein H5U40_13350 [Polyangiaceae bacterium]|nr:hypothetical protein [Polyangiaceae bacterium]